MQPRLLLSMATILATSHRPKWSILCFIIALSAFLQGLVLFYHPVGSRAPADADAISNSLHQFSSHSVNANNTRTNTKAQQGIPNWLSEYIIWHREQRQTLTLDNWNATGRKYLVMQCLNIDQRCGGTADRLKPIPTLLLLAFQYKRMLLIHWERPCKLDEFLQPTSRGLDWRVPEWLDPSLLGSRPAGTTVRRIQRHARANGGNDVVVRSRYQSDNGGAEYYNEHFNKTGRATFEQAYHSVWHAIFEPVAPLQQVIDETMKNLSLVPGEYAAAHLRATYGVQSRPQPVIRNWATNAVNCASQLRPGGPIFFASDSNFAISVVKRYAAVHKYKIVSLQHEKEPLHLEKSNHSDRDPSEYYDTFVDLYLLGNSRCLSYNVGGFGTWGLLMGYDSSCGKQHAPMHFRNYFKCDWANAKSSNVSRNIET